MNPAHLIQGEKYLYSPIVPSKHFCNLEQKREPKVLTYSHESPYNPGYFLFFDKRGEGYSVGLEGYIVEEQVEQG